MKKMLSKIGVVFVGLSALLIFLSVSMGDVLATKANDSAATEFSLAYYDSYNLYSDKYNKVDLRANYQDQVVMQAELAGDFYEEEILSFVQRATSNEDMQSKVKSFLLPMWPEYNAATYGNVTAYLYPFEEDPISYAKSANLITAQAKIAEYISRADFLELVNISFLGDVEDPIQVLFEDGLITKPEVWRMDLHNSDFPLVEALKLIRNIVESVNNLVIAELRDLYQDSLVDLSGKGVLELNEDTLQVIMKALQIERNGQGENHLSEEQALEIMQGMIEDQMGEVLTAKHLVRIRNVFFFDIYDLSLEELEELEVLRDLGDCQEDMIAKTRMGAIAKTGEQGMLLVCDRVAIRFPANAYLVNIFALPDIALNLENDKMAFRSSLPYSLQDSLILGEDGEYKVKVYYLPEDNDSYAGKSFTYSLYDADQEEIASANKEYSFFNDQNVAWLEFLPRLVSGENYFVLDYLL